MEKKDSENVLDETRQQNDSTDPTSILDLNDDCLIHIFQQLNILDRIRLERVCKRWQNLLKNSWYNVNFLVFCNKYWGFKNETDMDTLSSCNLKKVLSRCGRYLTKIMFYESQEELGPDVLGTVANYCPNIEFLYARDIEFEPASIEVLAERCNKIGRLFLGNSTDDCDQELAMLFKSNQNLKAFYVSNNPQVTGECLSALNADNIKIIYFENCQNIEMKHFGICRNFKNLTTLAIEHFYETSKETAEDISECFQNLDELTISCSRAFPFSSIQIAKLSKIEVLNVDNIVTMTDDLLVTVGNNCKTLKIVNVNNCPLVTNRGLASILALPKLEILLAEKLINVNDEVFNCAPNLIELRCNFCVNMKDEGISRLIKNSHKLKDIYLVGCEKITNRLITDAIKYTKQRENGIILCMYLNKSIVELEKINDVSPLFELVVYDDENHHEDDN